MHGIIVELHNRSFDSPEEYLTPEDVEAPTLDRLGLDYVDGTDRNEALEAFASATAQVFEWNKSKTSFTVNSDTARKWFEARLDTLKTNVAALTLETFCDELTAYGLSNLIEDECDVFIYYWDESSYWTLDTFMRKLKYIDATQFFVGGVLDYHM